MISTKINTDEENNCNLLVIQKIKEEFSKLDFVDTAILYGSSVKSITTRDIDIVILDLIYGSSFTEKLTKLFFIVQNNTFEGLSESEKIKFKTNIGVITEKIFKSFFTKEVDLSQFDLRIKSILSKKEQNIIIE